MSYGPLTENSEYIRKIYIGSDTTDMVTTAEKTSAEAAADAKINAYLETTFSTAGSPAAYPPLIVEIAKLLGSAQLYHYIYGLRTGQGKETEPGPGKYLEDKAMALLEKIKAGEMGILGADGEWVDGFEARTGMKTARSEDEADADYIFDIRAEISDWKDPADAYDEAAYS